MLTLRDVDLDAFLRVINVVKPTLIRVDADEVTYSLHVILRFELELELIDGSLDTADLPAAWAAKMKQTLGIAVPDDLHGVMQDIHLVGGDHRLLPDLRDRQRLRRAAVARRARRPARPRRRPRGAELEARSAGLIMKCKGGMACAMGATR